MVSHSLHYSRTFFGTSFFLISSEPSSIVGVTGKSSHLNLGSVCSSSGVILLYDFPLSKVFSIPLRFFKNLESRNPAETQVIFFFYFSCK